MDETQGMEEALKAAYAEVILNTMKEAAARVMESEQKALRIEQDLKSTKDDALRLLLRFKHMIDAKETEAEISSINQQRRIDELEAQLNEAEGLVVDLRAELNLVREELDEANKKKKSGEDDHVLSSMILKNKEAEMYRNNGFIQRIHADEKLHPGDDDPCFAAHSKPIKECTETVKKIENRTHQLRLLKGNVKRGKIKRRKSFHGKSKTNLHRCLRNELLKSKQPLPALAHCRNNSSKGNGIDSCGVTTTDIERINTLDLDKSIVLGEKVQQSNNAESILVRRSVRKRKIKYWDDAASVWRSHEDAKTSQRSHATLDPDDIEGRLRHTFSRKRKKNSVTNPVENASGEEPG